MTYRCGFCNSTGYWQHDLQTLYCPFCNTRYAEKQATSMVSLPIWHSAAWPTIEAKYYGPLFQITPWLLVIHSGEKGNNIAKYFHDPEDRRKVSTHLAWDVESNGFAQCVPFENVAWHVGKSIFRGDPRVNFYSVGIELPADYGQNELRALRESVIDMLGFLPLSTVVCHRDIDSRKRDPIHGFDYNYLDGLDLDFPFV